jgi:hypothetical protein
MVCVELSGGLLLELQTAVFDPGQFPIFASRLRLTELR